MHTSDCDNYDSWRKAKEVVNGPQTLPRLKCKKCGKVAKATDSHCKAHYPTGACNGELEYYSRKKSAKAKKKTSITTKTTIQKKKTKAQRR